MAPGGYETEEELEAKDTSVEGSASTTLDELQSKDYRHVLDVVDRLRTCGLGSVLGLPQLVVVGDQSSGKSSVLTAITGVPFPRHENLCTRFVTECVMRRRPQESIQTKIVPDSSRSEAEKAKLMAFNETISDLSGVPHLICKATKLMGLSCLGDDGVRPSRAFSRDVLRIELAGPDEEDRKLVLELVTEYLKEKRTIMLAVISAKNDYANQGISKKCKPVDPERDRTLGIITKPDKLDAGSNDEKSWLNLAQNKDVYFRLGWHLVSNRWEKDSDSSFKARDALEAEFFSQGAYRMLQPNIKGIDQLRVRLSQLLYKHLTKELPKLQADVRNKHTKVISDLADLGEKRSTLPEQRRFLMSISTAYEAIVATAVNGHYEHPFFGTINASEGFDDANNVRRLRAAVQYYNQQFASQMRRYGYKFHILSTEDAASADSQQDLPEPQLDSTYDWAEDNQEMMDCDEAVEWVKGLLVKTRGRELPGNSNPLLTRQLFNEQSENWELMAQEHVNCINNVCHEFVHAAIRAVATPEIADCLQTMKLDASLGARNQAATRELDSLIKDRQRALITYDSSCTAVVQKARNQRMRTSLQTLQTLIDPAKCDAEFVAKSFEARGSRKPPSSDAFGNGLLELLQPDMDQVSVEHALDSQLAYYKHEVTYFIAAVSKQVIERHFMHDLAKETLSPMIVNDMTDAEVKYFATEPEEEAQKRQFLENHKAILEDGQAEFRRALGSYK